MTLKFGCSFHGPVLRDEGQYYSAPHRAASFVWLGVRSSSTGRGAASHRLSANQLVRVYSSCCDERYSLSAPPRNQSRTPIGYTTGHLDKNLPETYAWNAKSLEPCGPWLPANLHEEDMSNHNQIPIVDEDGRSGYIELFHAPDVCTWCKKACHPTLRHGQVIGMRGELREAGESIAQLVYQCPIHECKRYMVCDFVALGKQNSGYWLFRWFRSHPVRFEFDESTIPQEIRELSPTFYEVYKQAQEAESTGLDQVSGPAFRKALEFLIKDFLISKNPADEQEIKGLFLGKCIDKITNENVKNCAKRAVWLGNDQTHYEPRWADKDVSDLKELIKLTMAWIHMEVLTVHFQTIMPSGAPV